MTVFRAFLEASRLYASRTAVQDGTSVLSYRDLACRAEHYARLLQQQGVLRGDFVVVCMERSCDLVAAILGVLMCGAAYVPLEADAPDARLHIAAADTHARCAISSGVGVDRIRTLGLHVILGDEPSPETPWSDGIAGEPSDVAYVIFTSGSTGTPKGVAVTHHNVLALFRASEGLFGFGPDDVWTLFHSIAFDFSVWELFGAVLYGGRLVIVSRDVARDAVAFTSLTRDEGVTFLNQTPSSFRTFVAAAEQRNLSFPALRAIVLGGERTEGHVVGRWFSRHGDLRPHVVNMYGITETTVHVTFRRLHCEDIAEWCEPIGRPLGHLEVLLCATDGSIIPQDRVHEAGEVYVLGEGLARGYLNRPELTRERFVTLADGRRAYRSGDLAQWLVSGELAYLGRNDDQVKIRGHRIELGEVAAALSESPGVVQSVVLVAPDRTGDPQLVAFYQASTALDDDELRNVLSRRLPNYMVPARFVAVDTIPLTSNGKVDRQRLLAGLAPMPETTDPSAEDGGGRLRGIWRELLGRPEAITSESSFFVLGGHSLLLLQLSERIREQFGVELGVPQLFARHRFGEQLALIQAAIPAAVDEGTFSYELEIDGVVATLAVTREQFETAGLAAGAKAVRQRRVS